MTEEFMEHCNKRNSFPGSISKFQFAYYEIWMKTESIKILFLIFSQAYNSTMLC